MLSPDGSATPPNVGAPAAPPRTARRGVQANAWESLGGHTWASATSDSGGEPNAATGSVLPPVLPSGLAPDAATLVAALSDVAREAMSDSDGDENPWVPVAPAPGEIARNRARRAATPAEPPTIARNDPYDGSLNAVLDAGGYPAASAPAQPASASPQPPPVQIVTPWPVPPALAAHVASCMPPGPSSGPPPQNQVEFLNELARVAMIVRGAIVDHARAWPQELAVNDAIKMVAVSCVNSLATSFATLKDLQLAHDVGVRWH